jgi:SAM-dependent methyltransferase
MKQTDLYHHYDKLGNHQSNDFRISSIINLILPYLEYGKLILDAGCGSCAELVPLLRMGHLIEGIEPSEEILSIGKRYLIKEGCPITVVKKISISDHSKEKKEHYEQIICLDVIEHIEDDLEAMNAIYQMLKKRGRLLLTVPAIPYLYGEKDKNVGHYRRYAKRELVSKIRSAGFIIKDIRYWNFLGLAPTCISVKLLKTGVSESFRQNRGAGSRLINSILIAWFNAIENNVRPPLGLTLFVYAEK